MVAGRIRRENTPENEIAKGRWRGGTDREQRGDNNNERNPDELVNGKHRDRVFTLCFAAEPPHLCCICRFLLCRVWYPVSSSQCHIGYGGKKVPFTFNT